MKKAFTLAEILIVLTIIGVMAVMTIPSLIQNSNSQQKIALFKKAFNAVSNAYATEFAVKTPPNGKTESDAELLWNALNNQLNVKYYVDYHTAEKIYTLEKAKEVFVYWRAIVTEDGIAYRVDNGSLSECGTKIDMNKYKISDDFVTKLCLRIGIILDGPFKYNSRKACFEENYGGDKADLNNLKCNSIWVGVSKEGITSGNPDCTISGRIISGVNPRPSYCDEE